MLRVGILGGMGPMATADLFKKIIECTPATSDQEHLKIIVYNNPQIPSRVEAILGNAQSPEQQLIDSALFLQNSGAELLVMPCNTAHFWYDNIKRKINIPFINMIENTADFISRQPTSSTSCQTMLFATAATIQTGMYQTAFAARGLTLITPQPQEQHIISSAIDQTKAGWLHNNPYLPELQQLIQKYQQAGTNAFIAGCTEIPLLFDYIDGNYSKIDPTELLARQVVKQALESSE